VTVTLDWVKAISACTVHRTASIPDHVTLATNNTEIWPFESPVLSTFRRVWSHMVAYW